jgi:hypothetical protein
MPLHVHAVSCLQRLPASAARPQSCKVYSVKGIQALEREHPAGDTRRWQVPATEQKSREEREGLRTGNPEKPPFVTQSSVESRDGWPARSGPSSPCHGSPHPLHSSAPGHPEASRDRAILGFSRSKNYNGLVFPRFPAGWRTDNGPADAEQGRPALAWREAEIADAVGVAADVTEGRGRQAPSRTRGRLRGVSGGCKLGQLWRVKIRQSAVRSGCRLRA